MQLQDFLETIQYKITDGSKLLWNCFGNDAYIVDSEESNIYSTSCTFDTKNQVVYMTEVYDYINERAYRWINPNYKNAYSDMCKVRGISETFAYMEDDDISFIDLEVQEDFLEKTSKIVQKLPYDTNITIPLDIPDNELLKLMIMAHEQNVTFNQLINNILERTLNDLGNNL